MDEGNDPYLSTDDAARRLLAAAPWRRFLVLGDSIAEGMGEPSPGYADLTWFERVRRVLGVAQPDLELLNLARRDLRAAAVGSEQLPVGLAFAPDLAVVVAGGNDVLGRVFDADAVEAELDKIVAGLTGIGATVVLVTLMDIVRAVPQLAGGPMERLPILNDRIRAVAQRHDALVLDAFVHPMCGDRDVYSADFKHPTMRGHAILATETLRVLATRVHG
ncbi:SGNH/GDSL hydrolase family protein [Micromonospora sp. NBC_01699]|uniref:SGNH/GDSL hydrolase family protein n=1 Tax=Micromonospora sp. NBC_01699 TaxID=2975984 RepID=UPI002E341CFA|nr:SGNH/GDSL hydrolase family protein [Micromonospora sp. NBC_01699]